VQSQKSIQNSTQIIFTPSEAHQNHIEHQTKPTMHFIYKSMKNLASLTWIDASKRYMHPTDVHYSSRSRFVTWQY